MTPEQIEQERQAFEKHYIKITEKGFTHAVMMERIGDDYAILEINCLWHGWLSHAEFKHAKAQPIGRLLSKNAVLMVMTTGTATTDNGVECELFRTFAGEPGVKNKQTNQSFILEWEDIVDIAVTAGIENT